ncbi:saccharopine dehydrogenase [Gordonia sp. SID5947]|uniref:saccharopine dehydrogenase n=1 Tax=Gordonia sp. SID5947 TaxID=2690315 RepID=UPI00136C015C|nr:saccharopine dehydrogenase [Gordonia sp. SID5947]MYR05535.1 saccharopine dehydrogenase [Gordonia sp. SID5947]
MKVLIVGASGAVGDVVAHALRRLGHSTTATSRSGRSNTTVLRLDTPAGLDALSALAAEHDVVVNTSGVEDTAVRRACLDVPFVDASATGSYLDELAEVGGEATTVLGAGLAPGVTTVLVEAVGPRPGDDIDVAIMLGSGEVHGTAAVEWTAGLVGQQIYAADDGPRVFNYRERRVFDMPGGKRVFLRADFPDQVLAGNRHEIRVRSYLALDDRLSTVGLALVGRLPVLRPALMRAPHRGTDRWQILVRNRVTGQQVTAHGRGQSATTGELVARSVVAAGASPSSGSVTFAGLLTVEDLRTTPGISDIDVG